MRSVRPAGRAFGLLLALSLVAGCAQRPTPPGQPASGPGGSDYRHGAVERGQFGSGAGQYWVFTPSGPRPSSAPVIVFNHGWLAMDPSQSEGWLTHLARRGNIVIYPRYQAGAHTPPREFTPNAAGVVRQALALLHRQGLVKPDTEKFAIVGHSAGGVIAANMAATWKAVGIPRPRAVMCVEPGRSFRITSKLAIPTVNYGTMDADTLLLCLTGADDLVVAPETAELIIDRATQVPPENKDLVVAFGDDHGRPPLKADHAFPTSYVRKKSGINALDFYACWKLFDGLTDAAFFGKNRRYALGNTPEQRHMGEWSDGTPVRELLVR